MSDLGHAIAIASHAFQDKKDKGGKPYILHCLHVMNKMKYENNEDIMIAAVLHDLIEDTEWTLDDLCSIGFSKRSIYLIEMLTHKKNEPYMDYIQRISNDKDAVKIKMQDLRHNSDITRMKGISLNDFDRLEKYHRAFNFLKKSQE